MYDQSRKQMPGVGEALSELRLRQWSPGRSPGRVYSIGGADTLAEIVTLVLAATGIGVALFLWALVCGLLG